MASGLSMPVGLKNSTDGSLQVAIDAMGATRHPHSFLGMNEDGVTSIVRTNGNPNAHVVLRGGRAMTNYDAASIAAAEAKLISEKLPPVLMVDCSHANSEKEIRQAGRCLAQRRRTARRRHEIAHRHDGREPSERRQPADPEKKFRAALRREHHGFVHRLGNHGADAALGL
jgi:3-deoxy-D-arabino-heptulosonate 7-phosphate (DAHP) synthase